MVHNAQNKCVRSLDAREHFTRTKCQAFPPTDIYIYIFYRSKYHTFGSTIQTNALGLRHLRPFHRNTRTKKKIRITQNAHDFQMNLSHQK